MIYSEEFLTELQNKIRERGDKFYKSFETDEVYNTSNYPLFGDCLFCKKKNGISVFFKSRYHCYECGADGDAISYLMGTRNCSFDQAVMILAAWVGYQFPLPEAPKSQTEHRKTHEESTEFVDALLRKVDPTFEVREVLSKAKQSSEEEK